MNERTTMNRKPVFRVPVKSVLNLNSGFREKLLCDGPTFSLGDACAYSCSFCYVPAQFRKLERVAAVVKETGKRHDELVILRDNALEVLREQLVHATGQRKFTDPLDRRVVFASPADDVAANTELCARTIEACQLILTHTHWQIRLLSKSNRLPYIAGALLSWAAAGGSCAQAHWSTDVVTVTEDDVRARMIFGVSTGTLDDGIAAAIEQGTPSVRARVDSLHVLQDNGFRTFAMVCPSLPRPALDYNGAALEFREYLRYDRCEHVWAEVINLRGESFTRTVRALDDAGLGSWADEMEKVAEDPHHHEHYARHTFLGHVEACKGMPGKLRFLVYPRPQWRSWWETQIAYGAVIL